MAYDIIEIRRTWETVFKMVIRCDVCSQIMHFVATIKKTAIYPSEPHEHWCNQCLAAKDQLPTDLRHDRRSVLLKRGILA